MPLSINIIVGVSPSRSGWITRLQAAILDRREHPEPLGETLSVSSTRISTIRVSSRTLNSLLHTTPHHKVSSRNPAQLRNGREIALMCLTGRRSFKLQYSTSDADADKLATCGVWRKPSEHRRCLVPADWFYEWQAVDDEKQARAFSLKGESPLPSLACRMDGRLRRPKISSISSAILTVEPNEWMAKYHDRMGVAIEPENYQQ